MDTKHTPTPWAYNGQPWGFAIYDKTQHRVATTKGETVQIEEANAEFIVTACNAYEDLKALNAELVEVVKAVREGIFDGHKHLEICPCRVCAVLAKAKEVK